MNDDMSLVHGLQSSSETGSTKTIPGIGLIRRKSTTHTVDPIDEPISVSSIRLDEEDDVSSFNLILSLPHHSSSRCVPDIFTKGSFSEMKHICDGSNSNIYKVVYLRSNILYLYTL